MTTIVPRWLSLSVTKLDAITLPSGAILALRVPSVTDRIPPSHCHWVNSRTLFERRRPSQAGHRILRHKPGHPVWATKLEVFG